MRKLLLGLFLLAGWQFSFAAVQNPVNMIQNTVSTLQNRVAQQKSALAQDPQKLYALVRQVVMPEVDVDEMAAMTLGPKWRTATPAQRQQFIDEFGFLLTKTYTNALLTVTDYNVVVYPLRDNAWQSEQYVSVNGSVAPKNGGQASAVTYYLERSGNSWKIYDMAVEGVSFMKNFQSQFQSFPDMPTLLARLTELNNSRS